MPVFVIAGEAKQFTLPDGIDCFACFSQSRCWWGAALCAVIASEAKQSSPSWTVMDCFS
jgi:hypothetical protein